MFTKFAGYYAVVKPYYEYRRMFHHLPEEMKQEEMKRFDRWLDEFIIY